MSWSFLKKHWPNGRGLTARRFDGSIKEQFKKTLAERLVTPRVPSAKLNGHPDRYKIKLRSIGYHLVYEVRDRQPIMLVVAVGKPERPLFRAKQGWS